LQIEGKDNPESDHEEETRCFGVEPRNELGLPSTPSTSPQGDLLHDIELAQILANMNDFIQPESPLNLNLGATQSLENSGHDRIISENVSCEVETRAKAIQEEVNQPGDMPPREPIQAGLNAENLGQIEEVEINQENDYQFGDTVLLEQS